MFFCSADRLSIFKITTVDCCVTCVTTSFHKRFKKRAAPSTPSSFHSSDWSGGAANRINRRTVSAPYLSINCCGSTVLPLDLDILLPSFNTIPCVNRFLNGSSLSSKPSSRINLWKKRAYRRCRTACSIPPMY